MYAESVERCSRLKMNEIKGYIRRFKKTKDVQHLLDICRLSVYYIKKAPIAVGAQENTSSDIVSR